MLKMRLIHLKFIERHSDYQAAYQYSFAMRHVERQMIMKNYSAAAAPLLKSNFRKPRCLPKLLGLKLNLELVQSHQKSLNATLVKVA